MIQLIFSSILMISLSVMLYLMVRALPRIAEEPTSEKHGLLDRWAHSQFPERVDKFLNGFLLKFFRRLRVVTMRLDNILGQRLQQMNPRERDLKPSIDFKEIAGQNKEGENQIT